MSRHGEAPRGELGVRTPELFVDDPATLTAQGPVSYAKLVDRVPSILSGGTSQAELEDKVGWSLDAFLVEEATAFENYPVDALKDICAHLGVDWIAALPKAAEQ